VTRRFQAETAAAGLPAIRWHDLRHSYITAALLAGKAPHEVAERTGHDVHTLLSTYAHVIQGHSRQAALEVAAFLRG
jgi:integrase